jgi:hypothetical protein
VRTFRNEIRGQPGDLQTVLSQLPARWVSGQGPYKVQVGDTVAVVIGCSSPLIVRKVSRSDHYRTIGEAFVHQFMYAAAMPTLPVQSIILC